MAGMLGAASAAAAGAAVAPPSAAAAPAPIADFARKWRRETRALFFAFVRSLMFCSFKPRLRRGPFRLGPDAADVVDQIPDLAVLQTRTEWSERRHVIAGAVPD